jgi:class 3 adenylate cyclase
MAEHVPPRVLVALMGVFFAVMTACALAFWAAAVVVPDGIGGVIGLIGFGVMTIFGTLHILAAITGVLLWQWERHRLPPLLRVALEAATLYFCLAVLASIFFNLPGHHGAGPNPLELRAWLT